MQAVSDRHGESEEKLLQMLRALVEGNEEIKNSKVIQVNDQFLLAFLRGRRYDVTNAYETICRYLEMRSHKYVDFFDTVNPSYLQYTREIPKFLGLLKQKDSNGCRIYVMRPPTDLGRFRCMEDVLAMVVLALEHSLKDEDATKHGVVVILDWTDFGFSHMKEITPTRLSMASDIFLNGQPLHLAQVHCVNISMMTSLAMTIASPFIPERLRNRITMHRNESTLYNFVPREYLPTWLGGYEESLDNDIYEAFDVHATDLNRMMCENANLRE